MRTGIGLFESKDPQETALIYSDVGGAMHLGCELWSVSVGRP